MTQKRTRASSKAVGYKRPPKEHQFKPGQSGNPTGRRKKPQRAMMVPDSAAKAFMSELSSLMVAKGPLKGSAMQDLTGAAALARMVMKDALTKDGPARRYMFRLFIDRYLDSPEFKEKGPREVEAETFRRLLHALVDPKVSEDDMERIFDDPDWIPPSFRDKAKDN